jgi:exonuclease SbcD
MSIKILHTSDWHIGKQLSRIDFSEDMNMFFDWLIELIEKQSIDVLLMSGDLFDQANPSQQAMRQYYLFLKRMVKLDCKVVLTGGNHDSAQVLNAPKELLEILDVKIVGGAPVEISELFIEVEKNDERLVIAAVPYLRDKDIRQSVAGETYNDKISQMRIGLRNYFESINSYYSANFSNLPFVMMGHLFVQGVSISESEREIQIGNQASIEANVFGDKANYVALGHIHRPQIVGSDHIRYCGSPIPMSFSEKSDKKQVVIVDFDNGKVKIDPIEIPVFRKLITLKGSILDIKNKLDNYQKVSVLSDLAELIVVEENENIESIQVLEQLLSEESFEGIELLKGKIEFKNKRKGTSDLLKNGEGIADFTPIELFQKRLAQDESIEDQSELMNAFRDLLEDLNQSNTTL